MKDDQIEILAPAGSLAAIKAAFNAGADAVYTGGELFGARAYADNPTTEQLLGVMDQAHLHKKKLYLTVNTLIKNSEMSGKMKEYITPFYENGLDAVIVQDAGLLMWMRDNFPGLLIHASTQMMVTGSSYGNLLKDYGITRIVTPRELSLKEIRSIADETALEIETFVHGALCVCYSGQCLMSSMLGGRSGNRGRCAQPCRLPYQLDEGPAKYVLSPKDLCGIEAIPDLKENGVFSFKIEGRMKKPEYAALTAYLYRYYADMYLEKGRDGFRVSETDIIKLMDLYNRGGFTKGYYYQHNGADMMTPDRQNHSGVIIGRAVNRKNGRAEVQTEVPLNAGDVLEFSDGSNETLRSACKKGQSIQLGQYRGRSGEVVRRIRNNALIDSILSEYCTSDKKNAVKAKISLAINTPATIVLTSGEYTVSVSGACPEKASNRPLTEETVRKQMNKTGNTPFYIDTMEVFMADDCYMGIQAMNELRRLAFEQLEAAQLSAFRRQLPAAQETAGQSRILLAGKRDFPKMGTERQAVSVLIDHSSQLAPVLESGMASRIYVNFYGDYDLLADMCRRIHAAGIECYPAMPYVFRQETEALFAAHLPELKKCGADGYLVRNMETLLFLKKYELTGQVISDYNMYISNNLSLAFYRQYADQVTMSAELNEKELGHIDAASAELLIYGYVPLMVTAQCIVKNSGKCQHNPQVHTLTDRYRKNFNVVNICQYCYNLIYNSVPTALFDEMDSIRQIAPAGIRLQFIFETPEEVRRILSVCSGAASQKTELNSYTKGHFKRGVE